MMNFTIRVGAKSRIFNIFEISRPFDLLELLFELSKKHTIQRDNIFSICLFWIVVTTMMPLFTVTVPNYRTFAF